MSQNYQFYRRWQLWKIAPLAVFVFLLLARIGYGQTQATNSKNVILQGSIEIQPVKALSNDQNRKIQPGTSVKIIVSVENKGWQATPIGELYVRYAFAHPLDKEKASIIFETEKNVLPSMKPGEKVNIAFNTTHQLPSLLDFIRYDWSMREYQALAIVNQEEYMIGTLAITFSAYYYPGIKKEFPTEILSE